MNSMISLVGLALFVYFFFSALQLVPMFWFMSNHESFQAVHYLAMILVSIVGAGVGTHLVWKSGWFVENVLSIGPDVNVNIGYPTVFLQSTLIILATIVLLLSLPSAIIEFFRQIYFESEMHVSYSFWKFSGADYVTNFLRSFLAVLILVFHRQISPWLIEDLE